MLLYRLSFATRHPADVQKPRVPATISSDTTELAIKSREIQDTPTYFTGTTVVEKLHLHSTVQHSRNPVLSDVGTSSILLPYFAIIKLQYSWPFLPKELDALSSRQM